MHRDHFHHVDGNHDDRSLWVGNSEVEADDTIIVFSRLDEFVGRLPKQHVHGFRSAMARKDRSFIRLIELFLPTFYKPLWWNSKNNARRWNSKLKVRKFII